VFLIFQLEKKDLAASQTLRAAFTKVFIYIFLLVRLHMSRAFDLPRKVCKKHSR